MMMKRIFAFVESNRLLVGIVSLVVVLELWGSWPVIAQLTWTPEDRSVVIADDTGTPFGTDNPVPTLAYAANSSETCSTVTNGAEVLIGTRATRTYIEVCVSSDTAGAIRAAWADTTVGCTKGQILDPSPANEKGGGCRSIENYTGAAAICAVHGATTIHYCLTEVWR